jgi:hypothetical protein
MAAVERENNESKADDILSLRSVATANHQFSNVKYVILAAVFLILPFTWPLALYFYAPQNDFGELMAVLGWPILFFLAGLFISSFTQPKVKDKAIGEDFYKLKLKAHNLNVAWLFFFVVFESFSVMCVLGFKSDIPIGLYMILTGLYTAYAVLCVWWLRCLKRIRHQVK